MKKIAFCVSRSAGYLVQKIITSLIILFFGMSAQAATYTLTSGGYPPCNTSWSVSGTTYTCTGNGRVTLASGDILASSTSITIVAANGFSLNNNTIGSNTRAINLTSSYGTVVSAGTNTLYGSIQGGSGNITLVDTTVSGTVTTSGIVNLTGGSVAGLVTSTSNTITTNNTSLTGGTKAQSGMSISGGSLSGAFTMTSNNPATFSNVTMASGSISGASTVTITGSVLGSSSSAISVTSTSGAISLNSSTVYGNLTAPSYSTVNVASGSVVSGSCLPSSSPANSCNAAPKCTTGFVGGVTGNYFNNMTLTGSPAGSRIDSSVNFDWGTGTTGVTGVGADNFSVRWTGSLRAPTTGVYQFQTSSDDGIRLWINNVLVLDNWNDHSVTDNTSTSVSLVAGQSYPVRLEFYENGGYAVAQLRWSQPTNSAFVPITTEAGVLPDTSTSCAVPVPTCDNGFIGGVSGQYYSNSGLSGIPAGNRMDGAIDFNWGTGAPGVTGVGADNFSVKWDGTIKVATSGSYQFETVSDDGVRLWVNGLQVISNWTDHGTTSNTTTAINLTAGVNYPVRLEYYENGGSSIIQLRWKKPADSSYSTINSCPSSLAGYTISASSTGITCAAEQITFTAVDGVGAVMAPPSGTSVTLSTSPGTGAWVGGNTYSFNGTATSFSKYLQQTTPSTLTMTITDGLNSATRNISFVDSALKFYNSAGNSGIQNQVAGLTSGSATPVATDTPILKAIRTDTVTGACVAQVTGSKSVNLAYECVNPTSCIAGQVFTVNGTAIQSNANGASIAYSAQNLTFDSTGTASIPINYSDVGRVNLYAQMTIPPTGNDPQKTLFGSSNSFVVKPYTLFAKAFTPSGGANPGGTSAAYNSVPTPTFVAGGSPFNVKVEARKYPGTLSSDIAPNFGRETTSEASTPNNGIKLTPALVYPAGGTLTPLTGSTSYGADTLPGTWLNSGVIWRQIGSITLQPELSDSDYLSAGDLVTKTPSGTIGRFYPDHFSLVSSSVTNSCVAGAFSYMGQPALGLNFQLQAQDANGNIMSNYASSSTPTNYGTLVSPVYVSENADDGQGNSLVGRVSSGGTLTASSGNIQMATTTAAFARKLPNSDFDGPFSSLQLGLDITDSFDGRSLQGKNMDPATSGICGGASCTAVSIGSPLNMRYGRLRLDDAFGPETYPLDVNFITEYWAGNRFVLNTADSCTRVPRSAITYPAGAISTDANRKVDLTGGSTFGTYGVGNINALATDIKFVNGSAGQFFTSPNGGKGRFVVGISLSSLPWFSFDWDQNGSYSDTQMPNATFEFGSYRGHDRIIYWRERLQ